MITLSPGRLGVAASILLMTFPSLNTNADEPVKGDLWETTSQVTMQGMPPGMVMPVQPGSRCLPQNSTEPPAGPPDQDCENSAMQRDGSKVTWTVHCSAPHEMNGVGEITYEGTDSYAGTIQFTSAEGNVTISLTGRKNGECDNPE